MTAKTRIRVRLGTMVLAAAALIACSEDESAHKASSPSVIVVPTQSVSESTPSSTENETSVSLGAASGIEATATDGEASVAAAPEQTEPVSQASQSAAPPAPQTGTSSTTGASTSTQTSATALVQTPASTPAPAESTPGYQPGVPMGDAEAFRLLEQASFGATFNDLEQTADQDAQGWIEAQMELEPTLMLPAMYNANIDRWDEHINVWWRNVLTADDQLRQRIAFALSQIFVVSSSAEVLGRQRLGLSNYYDILLEHSFGNFRSLLTDVTLSPVMGQYLSMKGNRKADPEEGVRPDENFARELMQLFTIGLVELNPDGTPRLGSDGVPVPTYDQSDIEELARVFTGWHFANVTNFRWDLSRDFLNPMKAFEDFHDTLLGGLVIPAGQTARQDLDMALDYLFEHPNVGPFISKQLIQRLVTSNPSPEYVEDVAAIFDSNAIGIRGSLKSTVQAILLHPEARAGHIRSPDTFGKLKEPLIRLAQLWRAFEPQTIQNSFNYIQTASELAQAPMQSETVFNFFRPDFSQPGVISDAGMVAPEFEIHDEASIITITMRLLAGAIWNNNQLSSANRTQIAIDIDRELALDNDRAAFINHLDRLLLGGRMSSTMREELNTLLDTRRGAGQATLRVSEAIFLVMSSPEAAVQQ